MTHGWAFLLLAVLHGLASLFNGEATGKGAGQLAGLHLYDTGHLLAAGGVTAGALWLWRRLVRGRYETLAGFAALALVCAAVGLVVLGDDVTLRAGRMPHWFKPHVWKILLSVGIAEGVCAAAIFAQRVRAGWALGLGAALGLGHAFVLPQLYPGVHLIAAWTAAVMMGVGLQEWAGPPFDRLPPTGRVIAVVGALAAAVVSLVVPPSPNVRSALGQSTVTVLAPYALRLHPMEMGDEPAVLTDAERPWYSPRPDGVRAPSTPPFALPDRHASGPTPPVVLLITIDCVRFDVMHDAAQLEQWPAFKALIERSVDFTDAHTPAPATAPALSTIYTGKYYSQLVWKPKSDGHRVQLWPAEDPSVRFPGLLTAQKIPNIFFASEDSLRAPWGVTEGFEQTVFPAPGTAPALVTATLDWLAKHPDGPAFVAIHILDPHWPYVMGGEEGPPKARYLAEIGTVDRALGGLFDGLDRLGLTARTVVIVTADHGEAFGEHGSKYHGANLYEVVEHVPLLVSVPGLAPRAEKTPVGGVDLGPTILDLFHQGTPTAFLGESLLPLLRGEPSHLTRPIVADSGRRSQGLYFPDGLKVTLDLRKKSVELFDLVGDPAELNNLFNPENPDHRARLAKLKAFFQAHEVRQAGYETPFRP